MKHIWLGTSRTTAQPVTRQACTKLWPVMFSRGGQKT